MVLEPTAFPPAVIYQRSLLESGIPITSFAVDAIQSEYERLDKLGVAFRSKPTPMGSVTIATFEDTCGNLIQIDQV